jgi:hypothetical protein
MSQLATPILSDAIREIRERRLRKRVIYVLSAFGDESSDEKKQRVFAVSGVFGDQNQWDALEAKWRQRLPEGLDFHAAQCESDQGDFSKFEHHENKALYKDLTLLLVRSGLWGYGVAMDLISQNKYMGELLPESPYYKCFGEVVLFFAHRAVMYVPREQVKFTFDRRLETEFNATALYDYMAKLPEWEDHDYLHEEVAFASRKSVGVQAADLYAYEVMKHLDNMIGPKKRDTRRSFQVLLNTERFGGHIYIDDYFKGLQEAIAKLDEGNKAAWQPGEYKQWLEKNGLSDTYAHRLRYTMQCDAIARSKGDQTYFEDVQRWSERKDLAPEQ